MQTEVTQRLDRFLKGYPTRSEKAISLTPTEDVKPGQAAVVTDTDGKLGRKPYFNSLDLTLSASFISTDVFSGTLKVYDLAGALVTTAAFSQTYANNSHDQMIEAIRAKFDAIPSSTALTTDVTNNRTITLALAGDQRMEISTAFAAAGGAAPTVTATRSSTDTIIGVWAGSLSIGNMDGVTTWLANKQKVAVLTQGDIPVDVVDSGAAYGDVPRALLEDYDADYLRGDFTTDSANPSIALSASIFASAKQSDKSVLLTVNMP